MFRSALIALCLACSALGFDQVTGSFPSGLEVIEVSPSHFRLDEILGDRVVGNSYFQLNGEKNSVEISLLSVGVNLNVNLDDGSGSLITGLDVLSVGIVSDPAQGRNYIVLRGKILDYMLSIELDYRPGMEAITGSTAVQSVGSTPYRFQIHSMRTGGLLATVTGGIDDPELMGSLNPEYWREGEDVRGYWTNYSYVQLKTKGEKPRGNPGCNKPCPSDSFFTNGPVNLQPGAGDCLPVTVNYGQVFSWDPVPGATLYEWYLIAGDSDKVTFTTTDTSYRWSFQWNLCIEWGVRAFIEN